MRRKHRPQRDLKSHRTRSRQKARLVRIAVIVTDKPGTLQKLTGILAEQNANILEVEHDRLKPHLEISEAQIEFLLETRDENHILKIQKALQEAGIRLAT